MVTPPPSFRLPLPAHDAHLLYELCVQSPSHTVELLRRVHGNQPIVLREDFCGTAAVSRRWCMEGASRGDGSRAVGVEIDAAAVSRAAEEAITAGVSDRLTLIRGDATSATDDLRREPADVIFVGNFSIGYIHERARLIDYLRSSKARLLRCGTGRGDGIFACDTYGGESAFKPGGFERTRLAPCGGVIRYSWQREFVDPLTGLVENSISFRIEVGGEVVRELPRAFRYRWRLWSIHELREALLEAGFAGSEVYSDVETESEASPRPVADPSALGENWAVLVVGRASPAE